MRLISNQPVRFFSTAKTHKFNKNEVLILKTGTYTYNASKIIANYFKPLAKSDFIISDTLSFLDTLKEAVNSED